MCINMRRLSLPTGLTVEVPCHICWQCRADRVRNWTGKCIAESQTSAAVDFVTLTYCEESSPHRHWIKEPVSDGHAEDLHYEDVQKYLKRIRKAGHKVRYVVAGEYGERKNRAHWHILLFWQEGRPKRMLKQQAKRKDPNYIYGNEWQDEFWHHGHVNYQPFNEAAAKYVCKYLLKWDTEQEKTRKTKFRFSARPGIGFNWICDHWVQLHVDRQLSPKSPAYKFADVCDYSGKPREFRMSPHAQVKFVQEFERRYYARWDKHPPPSAWCDKILDKLASPGCTDALERKVFVKKPDIPPPNGERIYFDETRNAWFFYCGGIHSLKYYWSFDSRGERAWSRSFVAPSVAERYRREWEAACRPDPAVGMPSTSTRPGPPPNWRETAAAKSAACVRPLRRLVAA